MKYLLHFLTFALMVGGVCAQSNTPSLSFISRCPSGMICSGKVTYADGVVYIGDIVDVTPAREGQVYFPKGKSAVYGPQAVSNFVREMALKKIQPIDVYVNNQSAVILASAEKNKLENQINTNNELAKASSVEAPSLNDKVNLPLTSISPEPSRISSETSPSGSNELNRLLSDVAEAKKKQAELEAQLTLVKQEATRPVTATKIIQTGVSRIALVIGNANYRSSPLKNPVNDASDISDVLKQSGFEVIDQRNSTLQEMTRGIREFGDRLLKSDVGLVYFSGHGIEVNGRNYLLPVNASMDREDEIAFQAVDANLILEKMNTAKKSVNILIVDACRDNPFARSFRSTSKGLAQMDAPSGTIVSFSTSPGKIAADGDGRNSPFTKNLVKAMMRTDMPIEAMFKEVRKSVVEETKGQQTPWESSSLIGDFYFKVSK